MHDCSAPCDCREQISERRNRRKPKSGQAVWPLPSLPTFPAAALQQADGIALPVVPWHLEPSATAEFARTQCCSVPTFPGCELIPDRLALAPTRSCNARIGLHVGHWLLAAENSVAAENWSLWYRRWAPQSILGQASLP